MTKLQPDLSEAHFLLSAKLPSGRKLLAKNSGSGGRK